MPGWTYWDEFLKKKQDKTGRTFAVRKQQFFQFMGIIVFAYVCMALWCKVLPVSSLCLNFNHGEIGNDFGYLPASADLDFAEQGYFFNLHTRFMKGELTSQYFLGIKSFPCIHKI